VLVVVAELKAVDGVPVLREPEERLL